MSLVLLEMPGLKSKCLSMCSPEYRVPQLRSQQDAATAEAGTRGMKYRQKENSSSSSQDVSAGSCSQGQEGQKHGATQHWGNVTTWFSWWSKWWCDLIPSSPGTHASQAASEFKRHDKQLEKMNGYRPDLDLAALHLTPGSLWPKPTRDMRWPSDSSCYFSFKDKAPTQGIFKSFPCERSMLLSKHSAFSYPCAAALFPVNEINEFGEPGTALIND